MQNECQGLGSINNDSISKPFNNICINLLFFVGISTSHLAFIHSFSGNIQKTESYNLNTYNFLNPYQLQNSSTTWNHFALLLNIGIIALIFLQRPCRICALNYQIGVLAGGTLLDSAVTSNIKNIGFPFISGSFHLVSTDSTFQSITLSRFVPRQKLLFEKFNFATNQGQSVFYSNLCLCMAGSVS